MHVLRPAAVSGLPLTAGLGPSAADRFARATVDLRLGLPVVLTGPAGALAVASAETVDAVRLGGLSALAAQGAAGLVAVISARRAAGLAGGGDGTAAVLLTLPPDPAPGLLRALADPALAGEAAVLPPARGAAPMAELAEAALRLARAAGLLPAVVALPLGGGSAALGALLREGLCVLPGDEIASGAARARPFAAVSTARLPMAAAQAGRVHVFRPDDAGTEHYAIEVGTPDPSRPVLVRLHSACFTGDVLGSLKCDCGPQLRAALDRMADEGAGVLLYLNQEGRGIGLANKMRAYALQDRGLDTVEANHHLGFEDDERDFRVGAALLAQMGIGRVRLLTNNPAKVAVLSAHGVEVVERVGLQVGRTDQNARYLATKAAKSGHLL
jgi:GTP cyclohydrolase II